MPNGANPSFTISCKNCTYQRGPLWEYVWKNYVRPSTIHIFVGAHFNRSIHIYLRKYVWNGQKGRHQIYILSETLLVKPKLHTTTGKGYHTGHFGLVNKKSSRSWEQKTLIFNSNNWQKSVKYGMYRTQGEPVAIYPTLTSHLATMQVTGATIVK